MNWKFFALGSALFAALTTLLAKVGVRDMPSNQATLLRVLVIVPFLVILVWMRGEWRPLSSLEVKPLTFLLLSGIATGFSWLCFFRALQLGPASLVSAIDKLSLVLTVVLAALLFHEHPTLWQWAGAGLIATGTLLVALK